jgi:hypothetical protein
MTMFNKNHKDPLVDAVQAAMQKGAQDRAAIAKVNETFGIQAKRQLPHERHAEYDKAIATALNGGGPKSLTEETVADVNEENWPPGANSEDQAIRMNKVRDAEDAAYKRQKTAASKAKAKDGAEKRNKEPYLPFGKNALKHYKAGTMKLKEMKEYGVDGERARANPKAEKLKAILKRRLGKGDGKESVSQSRREDK